MSRRKGREFAVQALFSMDFNQQLTVEEIFYNLLSILEMEQNDVTGFAKGLLEGTVENITKIDFLINKVSKKWKWNRIAYLEKNVTRLALYELYFAIEKLPPKVVINEAVEIAKSFAGQKAGKFVNGILSSIIKEIENEADSLTFDDVSDKV